MFLFLLLTFVFACNDEGITNVDRVAGFYKAIVFQVLGSRDQPIDILAEGGALTAQLSKDFKVEGSIMIPAGIDSNNPGRNTTYSGIYTLSGDTLVFKNTATPMDALSPFLIRGSHLESIDKPGRGRGFKILLEKQ
jgi:hypothetical protein